MPAAAKGSNLTGSVFFSNEQYSVSKKIVCLLFVYMFCLLSCLIVFFLLYTINLFLL